MDLNGGCSSSSSTSSLIPKGYFNMFEYDVELCWNMLKHAETNLPWCDFLLHCLLWLQYIPLHMTPYSEAPFPFALEIQPLRFQSCEANRVFQSGCQNWVVRRLFFVLTMTPKIVIGFTMLWRWGTENLGSRRRAANFPCETSGDRLCPCANAAWPGKFQAVTSRHVVAKLCRSKLCGPLQPGPAWSAVIAIVCGYGYLWITTWKLLIHINWKVVGEPKKWSATGFLFINGSKLYGFHCFPLFSYGFLDILVNQLIKHHVGTQIHQFSANMSLGLGLALRCYSSEGILNREPLLVGVWATPLKNMSSSVGMMTFPIGKS